MSGPHIIITSKSGRIVAATFHLTRLGADRRAEAIRRMYPPSVSVAVYDLLELVRLHKRNTASEVEQLERMME